MIDLSFRFTVGDVTATVNVLDAGDYLLRVWPWTFERNGTVIQRRRCRFEGATDTAVELAGTDIGLDAIREAWDEFFHARMLEAGALDTAGLPPLRPGPDVGFVYLIQCLDRYKIGFTARDPRIRLHALQTGNSHPLRLIAYFRGRMEDEKALHARWARHRVHLEWFEAVDGIRQDFEALTREPTRTLPNRTESHTGSSPCP